MNSPTQCYQRKGSRPRHQGNPVIRVQKQKEEQAKTKEKLGKQEGAQGKRGPPRSQEKLFHGKLVSVILAGSQEK